MIKACILFAAGTNCDSETAEACRLAGSVPETVHINQLKSRERRLADYQVLIIPGGFSYGDYISSGRILANELKHNLQDDLLAFHAAGKPILGICNGFQVLVKSGMLPGFERLFEPQSVTLDTNDSGRYEDRWVHLRVEDSPCVFTRGIESLMYLPVAHAEGKFLVSSAAVLTRLNRGQVVLRYAALSGEPPAYPENPNGSEGDIAGICDRTGLVFGLMPHPERFVRREQHPRWHRERLTKPQGIAIFENAVKYAQTHV